MTVTRTTQSSVRIIGGTWRGRKLPVAPVEGLRPTGDRIRETLFNWLMPSIGGANCLDLFAGTGALALEAISRGADTSLLIDSSAAVCRQLQQNITMLKTSQAQVTQADTVQWLSHHRDQLRQFNIIFIDPPFGLNAWDKVMALLAPHLVEETLIYIESPKNQLLSIPERWHVLREKSAGSVAYRLLQSTV